MFLQQPMKNTFFYLATCDTCKRIIKETQIEQYGFIMQDIKTNPITEKQLDELKKQTGSYELLFSRRAQLYKSLGLAEVYHTDSDYKRYILQHYTFLKRPLAVVNNKVFVGSDKTVIAALKEMLSKL
jgi:arsenate reductase